MYDIQPRVGSNCRLNRSRTQPVLVHRVKDDGGEDDRAAEDGPVGGAFADEEKDPDRIEDRLDKADDARIERTSAAGDAFDKEDIREADLEDAEKADGCRVEPCDGRQRFNAGRQCDEGEQQIAVNNGDRRIHTRRTRMAEQHYIEPEEDT